MLRPLKKGPTWPQYLPELFKNLQLKMLKKHVDITDIQNRYRKISDNGSGNVQWM